MKTLNYHMYLFQTENFKTRWTKKELKTVTSIFFILQHLRFQNWKFYWKFKRRQNWKLKIYSSCKTCIFYLSFKVVYLCLSLQALSCYCLECIKGYISVVVKGMMLDRYGFRFTIKPESYCSKCVVKFSMESYSPVGRKRVQWDPHSEYLSFSFL